MRDPVSTVQYDLLISNGHIVTLDTVLGDLSGADIVVRKGVIADIGPDMVGRIPQGRVIDARGRLVLPGLVDAHRHVWQGARQAVGIQGIA
jgi:5-methylthioadenosine/S-adenosylhomocysteine deaminase